MTRLHATDFAEWMREVHGHEPFPWQERLLSEVLLRGWPSVIAMPTSSGKTAALDVAVFALALELDERKQKAQSAPADGSLGPRRNPLRVAFVVDRRLVVDGAFERAERLRAALDAARTPLLAAVAAALRSIGAERPLHTALLRGGIYREDRWARQPNQPTVLCSTVDQVGSRLLHRGYGLSSATWPIHAGLLGNDTLVVLDEAHCSEAFLHTLEQLAVLRARAERPVSLPFALAAMTATPRSGGRVFEPDARDLAHPVLSRRLTASKPMELRSADKGDRAFVAKLVEAVREHARPGSTLLAVVNRVRTARELQQALAKLPAGARPELLLLTGRARPCERDALVRAQAARLLAGRSRADVASAPPLVVVATQCVEVGADLDVDVLVSEACPLDALRQRLGRLNRLGELSAAPCVVVSRSELAWAGVGDPPRDTLYGEAVAHTWRWLSAAAADGILDGGVHALADRARSAGPELRAPNPHGPIVFPEYCDLWAQTGPVPAVSPDPAVFLHGPQRASADVQLVWRADLDGVDPDRWPEAVALCAPVAAEALALPLPVVQRWLLDELRADGDDGADVEGLGDQAAGGKLEGGTPPRPFVRWRGLERSEVTVDVDALRPGDTLVVPASYGGCDDFGWEPGSKASVRDLADLARVQARRAPVLRIHPAVLGEPGAGLALAHDANDVQPEELDALLDEAIDTLLARLAASPDPPASAALVSIASAVRTDRHRLVEPHPSGRGWVVTGRAGWASEARDFSDEDDTSSAAPRELSLAEHLTDVRDLTREYALATGLDQLLVEDLALAAHLHDLGKADPRFQAWLRGGDRFAAARGALLAKSPRMPSSLAALLRARARAGYPEGGRHELLSVRLAESHPSLLARAHDRDLVLHLVESHHGRCRPFAPVVADRHPLEVYVEHEELALRASSATQLERLDSGVADRFFALLRRYGWWGLSYLEACVRLADHRASERAQGADA
jgi:CRISPR-associated endonuclease/helicase Cas3